jgi:hypothetical protein
MATVRRYPLLLGFREVVLCKGFVAGIEVANARALVEEESDGWWISGVNPGAMADGGRSFSESVQNFCARFRAVLADYAAEADDPAEFQQAVTAFFNGSDAETLAEWEAARVDVRSGQTTLCDLPKDSSGRAPSINVTFLRLAPSENVPQPGVTALAA